MAVGLRSNDTDRCTLREAHNRLWPVSQRIELPHALVGTRCPSAGYAHMGGTRGVTFRPPVVLKVPSPSRTALQSTRVEEPMKNLLRTLALTAAFVASAGATLQACANDGDRDDHGRHRGSDSSIQVGPRPFYLVDGMDES